MLVSAIDKLAEPKWGLNLKEFERRFDPQLTENEGPYRLKNLYFLYLLELCALAKAAPHLEKFVYYTSSDNDADVKIAVTELLSVIKYVLLMFIEMCLCNTCCLLAGRNVLHTMISGIKCDGVLLDELIGYRIIFSKFN